MPLLDLFEYTKEQDRHQAKLDIERDKWAADPAIGEKLLAHAQALLVPEKKREKLSSASNLAKVEKAIPGSDPRKALGTEALNLFRQALPASSADTDPRELMGTIYNKLTSSRSEETNRYIQKEESALFGGRKDLAKPPGYEEWKKGFVASTQPEGYHTNLLASAAFGAGFSAAGQGIKRLLSKPGLINIAQQDIEQSLLSKVIPELTQATEGRILTKAGKFITKLPFGEFIEKRALRTGATGVGTKLIGGLLGRTPAAGPWGVGLKIAGAALMAMPDFALFDLASFLVKKGAPEWSAQRPLQTGLLATGLSVPAIGALTKGIGKAIAAKPALEAAERKVATTPTASNLLELSKKTEEFGKASEQDIIGYDKILSQFDGWSEGQRVVAKPALFTMPIGAGRALPAPATKIYGEGFETVSSIGYKDLIASFTNEGVASGLSRTEATSNARNTAKRTMGMELTNQISENPLQNVKGRLRNLNQEQIEGVFKAINEEEVSLSRALDDAEWLKANYERRILGPDKVDSATYTILRRAFGTGEEGSLTGVVKENPYITTTLLKKANEQEGAIAVREKAIAYTLGVQERSIIESSPDLITRLNSRMTERFKTLLTPEDIKMEEKAKELGITYNGMQDFGKGVQVATFTDTGTSSKSTFLVKSGETIESKLTESRKINKVSTVGDKIIAESIRRDEFNSALDEIKTKIKTIVGKETITPLSLENRAWTEVQAAKTMEERRAVGLKWYEVFSKTPEQLNDEEFKTLYRAQPVKDRIKLSKAYHQRHDALSIRETADIATKAVPEDLKPLAQDINTEIKRMTTAEYIAQLSKKERILSPEKAANKAEREKVLAMDEKEYDTWRKNNVMLVSLIGTIAVGAASVAVSTLMPSEAEAASPAELAGRTVYKAIKETVGDRTVSKFVAQTIGPEGGSWKDFLPQWLKAGMLSPKISEDGLKVEQYQNPILVNASFEDISRKKRLPFGLDRFLGVFTQGQIYYGGRTGTESMTNPAVGLGSVLMAYINNTLASMKVFRNIMKEYRIKSSWKEVAKEMKPISDKYHLPIAESAAHYQQIDALKKVIEKEKKSLAKAVGDEADEIRQVITNSEERLKFHANGIEARKELLKSYHTEYDLKIRELAQKHSSVRISLLMEDRGKGELYPWLKGLTSRNEEVAAARMTDMMEDYAARMLAVGQDPITSKGFVHYSPHPDVNYNKIAKHLEGLESGAAASPRLIQFYERSIGGRNMMPDIFYSMERYLPDANKRIAMGDFWGKGRRGSWYEHSRSNMVQSNEGLRMFWESVNRSFDPFEYGSISRFANRVQSFEIFRLLNFSPSVSFKHAIKMEANWSNFGWLESMKMIPTTTALWARKMTPESLKGTRTLEDAAVKAYIGQGATNRIIADMSTFDVPRGFWDRYMDKINTHGSVLIDAVENFDRSHSFVAAATMATKKGMTPSQAAYGIMDTILKTNFLAGALNPSWLRDPKVRLLFLFQGTPFKIAEQRAIQLWKAGKSIGRAGTETKELLGMLRKDVKEGEYALKYAAIKDALNSERDIWGTSITQQVMRKMIILGGMTATANFAFNADMFGHVVHAPFLEFGKGRPSIRLNPVAGAAYETWMKREEEDRGFWMSEFLKAWIREPFVQANVIKAMRLSNDDIPEIYRDSRVRYLLAVPATKE
jgi:hypothetical protein